MRILLVGGFGKLGASLNNFLLDKGHEVGLYGRKNSKRISSSISDINTNISLNDYLNKNNPNLIINLAALTDVDRCENEKVIAYESNVKPCITLKEWISKNEAFLIHISTDHLYSGLGPNKENEINPINEYARTKLEAEKIINSSKTVILRINYVGKSILYQKPSYTDWLYQSILNKNKLKLFNDVIFSPLHITDLLDNINFLIKNPLPGIYNVGSSSFISKSDFALQFANKLNLKIENYKLCESIKIKDRIKRPLDMSMDVSLFEKKFKVKLPSISHTINQCVSDYL